MERMFLYKFSNGGNMFVLKQLFLYLVSAPLLFSACQKEITTIERPEKIVSMRQVVYDIETYSKLASLWNEYYESFPSDEAYANWMYAARYAKDPDYKSLLEKGIGKYPDNPTMLYLKAILSQGKNNLESLQLLEKAVQLDPSYADPWFSLAVSYMEDNDLENVDVALKKILESGATSDVIIDYNYNKISLLEEDAVLITNGDNDTYPGWIITKIFKYRPDVKIVNRSLLNTEWYPDYIQMEGVPNFINYDKLLELRENILSKMKEEKQKMPATGPFSDALIELLIEKCKIENRPVYLASTLYHSEVINEYKSQGENLGLVTLVNSGEKPYSSRIENLATVWLNGFRTGGLQSWSLVYSKEFSASKNLILNYAASLKSLMDEFIKYTPGRRLELFEWYQKYINNLIPTDKIDKFNSAWCKSTDIEEISNWCRNKNYIE